MVADGSADRMRAQEVLHKPGGAQDKPPRLRAHACGEFEPAGRVRELDRRPQHYQATHSASSCLGKEGLDHWDRVDR